MYFVAFLGILITVSAARLPPISGSPTHPDEAGPTHPNEAGPMDPERCCAPAQYTAHFSANIAGVLDTGKLSTIFTKGRVAYDSINELIGHEIIVENLSNGTEKVIMDYNKLKGYYITTKKGVVKCQKFPLEGNFPQRCVPDDAVFIGQASLGDRALVADQWYITETEDSHTTHQHFSVKTDGCVDLGSHMRIVDSNTGMELQSDVVNWYDFKLGIDDPGRWFKLPAECEGVKATKIPSQLRQSPGYGRKLKIFY
ncbi:uncharacterized protein LOC117292724 [Asterias rubens]|uniref:uncharacterized protein LOC117292724 n=1 Tax=Asterias rubens TaxID=7604 RepID=UPI001455D6C4|nr:uncharacterized protein LOC117292724 [Asterias rubens]